jgi:error-prone DNA polymerase
VAAYAELHCHTHFSFLDGASAPDELVARAVELGMSGLAVTDHNGLYGVVRFSAAAHEAGLRPVIGVEIEMADAAVPVAPTHDPAGVAVPARRESRRGHGAWSGRSPAEAEPLSRGEGLPARPRPARARLPAGRDPVKEDLRGIGDGQRGPHLVLLARNAAGYRSLCRLVSRANLAGTKSMPRFSHELLAQNTDGLVALSGCREGEIARRLRAGDREGARAAAERYARLFAARSARQDSVATASFFLEMQHHLLPDDDWLVAETARLAGELGLPVVVTNDVHYAYPEGREMQDVVTAIRHGRSLDELRDLRRPDGESYLKSDVELMAMRPADAGSSAAWAEGIGNTGELAAGCSVDLGFERYRFPGFPVPKGHTPFSYLEDLCHTGARRRYHPISSPVVKQLAHELDVIEKTGLAEFFLICWDIMRFAREAGIPAQGRGSAANSIVAYVLGITRVDPIRHRLLFERFINEGRTSYPDIDIDFSSERREEVIQYVYRRYGPEHTGMVCNLVTYRARSAVREVGYALGFPRPLVDRVAKALETYDSVMVRRDLEADGGFGAFFAETVERAAAGMASGAEPARGADAHTDERGFTGPMGELNLPHQGGVMPGEPFRPHFSSSTTAGRVIRRSGPKEASEPVSGSLDRAAPHSELRVGDSSAGHVRGHHHYQAYVTETGDLGGGSATEQQRMFSRRRTAESDDEGGPGDSPAGDSGSGSTAALPQWERWLAFCARIDGFPRHLSIHSGGMLVTAAPLIDLAPVERATMANRVVVQFDKRDVETLKLIKLDLLGLGMLAAIDETLQLIEQDCAACIDLDRLPEDVPEVFEMLQAADTVGVFQVESRAQMQTLPKSKPANLDDLVVEVAIIRPGPIQGNAVHPYLRRRQGLEPTTYLHPSLQPVLEETLGVILYQEQVMQIAITVAGFSPGESDGFRRAMGTWRSSKEMEKLHQRFVDGCRAANGLTDEQAEELFRRVAAFASFGFAKSHAAAFARTAYESAFLKLFYPAQFTVGLINAQPMGFYPVEVLINDAKRHGVAVLPVDVNASTYKTSTEWVGQGRQAAVRSSGCIVPSAASRRRLTPEAATGCGIRLGLALVKGIGDEHAERLDAELERGSYATLADVVARTELPEEVIERMIRAGALDSLGRPRRELLWQLREVMGATRGRPTGARTAARTGAAGRRVAGARPLDLRLPPTPAPPLPELTERERLGDSYAMLSLDARRQVVSLFRPALARLGAVTNASLADRGPGPVRLGGLVVTRQHPMTAKGTVFLALEDETGMVNVTLWPDVWARLRGVVRRHALLYVEGMLQREANVVNVVAREIKPLPAVAEKAGSDGPGGPSLPLEGVRSLGYSGMRCG